jgi:hypothetical protein
MGPGDPWNDIDINRVGSDFHFVFFWKKSAGSDYINNV